MIRRGAVALLLALGLLGTPGHAEDEKPGAPAAEGAEKPTPAEAGKKPAAVVFGDDLEAARKQSRTEGRPLLVVAVPDWYTSPAVTALREQVLTSDAARKQLAGFVRVLVQESPDREVHARHRVKARGYPLAVVLSAAGEFLGSTSGLPAAAPETAWPARIAAIPGRHAAIRKLEAALRERPEHPASLLALAELHLANEEPARADALLARLDAADPQDTSGKLGEARYLRLRIATVKLLGARRFDSVEPLCNKWLRRFREHARRPDVLLLQANARYLDGKKKEARALWSELTTKHAKSDAARQAQKALAKLDE